jgi:hypothetical protein
MHEEFTVQTSNGSTILEGAQEVHQKRVLISVSGQTSSLDITGNGAIVEMQEALQKALQMPGKSFDFYDANGTFLVTDMQVGDAIDQELMPLRAMLSDTSLHTLEYEQQELAQMQWKVIRDQVAQCAKLVNQFSREMSSVQMRIDAVQRDTQITVEKLQQEVVRTLQRENFCSRADLHSVNETVSETVRLIEGERNKRELSVQSFEAQLQSVCELVDSERSERRLDSASSASLIQDLQRMLVSEREAREELQEIVRGLRLEATEIRENINDNLQDTLDRMTQLQADINNVDADFIPRLSQLEDQCTTLETHTHDTNSFNTQTLDKLAERQERLSETLDTVRVSCKYLEGNMSHVIDLEASLQQHDSTVRGQLAQEKVVREDSLRRIQLSSANDSKKQIVDLETRLTVRLERESAEREKHFKSMIDEVSRIVDDRKLFRDQTITKTIKVADLASAPPSLQVSTNDVALVDSKVDDSAFDQKLASYSPTSDATRLLCTPRAFLSSPDRVVVRAASASAAVARAVGEFAGSTPILGTSYGAPGASLRVGRRGPMRSPSQASRRSPSPVQQVATLQGGPPTLSQRSPSPLPSRSTMPNIHRNPLVAALSGPSIA